MKQQYYNLESPRNESLDVKEYIRNYHESSDLKHPYMPKTKPQMRSLSVLRGNISIKKLNSSERNRNTLLARKNQTFQVGGQELSQSSYHDSENQAKNSGKLETMKDLRSENNLQKQWQSERKNIFPIKKLDIVQNFKQCDQETFRSQLDEVIDKPTDRYYNHDKSTFKYIENTLNFRHKLDQIDDLVYSQLFKSTLEQIQPHYVYKKDEILDKNAKKRKLYNVKDNLEFNLKEVGVITDHKGSIVTKSGSKFDNLKEMLDRQKQKNEYFQNKRQSKMKHALDNIKNNSMIKQMNESVFNEVISESISSQNNLNLTFANSFLQKENEQQHKENHEKPKEILSKREKFQGGRKRLRSIDRSKSLSKVEVKTKNSGKSFTHERSFISQLSNNPMFKVELVSEVSQWFVNQVEKKMRQSELLQKYQEFKQDLEKQLEDEIEDSSDYDVRHEEEEIEKKMISSAYNDETMKDQTTKNFIKNEQKIVKVLLGENFNSSIKQALKQNDTLQKGLDQVQDKLSFMGEIQKAQKHLQNLVQKKQIKRFKIEGFDKQQVKLVAAKLITDLQNMQEFYDQKFYENQEVDMPYNGSLQDAIREFVKECTKENVTPPNLYKKIEENRLNMGSMNLQRGICRALARSIKRFVPNPIDRVVFSNNNLNDDNFAILLEALVNLQDLKGIYNVSNSFGKKSIDFIKQILLKPPPFNLQELCLNGCKLQAGLVSDLLENLRKSCHLKVLGLSEQSFDLHSCLSLIKMIKNSQSLKNLDISYSRFFKEKAVIELLKSCSTKHSLEYLNISFNTVKEGNKLSFALALKTFIIISKSITHLNISACGLRGQNALLVFQSLRKSKTLQSVHFSGNELEVSTSNQIRQMLGAQIQKTIQNNNINLYTNEVKEKIDDGTLPQIESSEKIKLQISKEFKQKRYDLANRPSTEIHIEETNISIKDQYIFSRILGHTEIQNGHHWIERDCCWICNKWQYVLVLWSDGAGDSLFEQKPHKYLSTFEQAIQKANQNRKIDLNNSSNPIIFGHATNFEQKVMFSMSDFKEKLEENLKPHQRVVQKEEENARIDELVQKKFLKAKAMVNLMRRLGGGNKPVQVQQVFKRKETEDQFIMNQEFNVKSVFMVNKVWPKQLEDFYVKIEHQELVLLMEVINLKLKPDELYFAFADYYPPGQSQFFIQSKQKKQVVYTKNIEINHRGEEVFLNYKKIKKVRVNRNFQLKQSVFASWAVDINQEYKKAFEADMKYSKIKKFIKDPTEFKSICNVLLSNYAQIYEVYVYCSGRSNYPSVQWIDFTDQCSVWKLIDKNLTLATIDRLFIAVNFEGVPGGLDDNPDKELCRYEFFEIIVRMAIAKYPNHSPSEALTRILQEHLLCDPGTLSWWDFRIKLIWTLEVDDLLKTNMSNIKKLFNLFLTSLKKSFTIDDGVLLIEKCPELGLTAKDAKLAHAYSNMLVVDEMYDLEALKQIDVGEFNEYIARLGQIKYRDPQMSLYDKIFKVLTELFKLIGTQPVHPMNDDLGESESDYDEIDDNFIQQHMMNKNSGQNTIKKLETFVGKKVKNKISESLNQ